MKPIQYFNAVALAAAASFAVTLGVVTLIYAVYLDQEPRLREDWGQVSGVTAIFFALTAIAAITFWGQRRGTSWRWIAQLVLVASIGLGGWLLYRALA